MKGKIRKTGNLVVCLLIIATVFAISFESAEGATGFREDFSDPILDPSWQILSGLGSYSLTDRPGYLRYYLMGPRAHASGWQGIGVSGWWSPSLTLIRPFEGTDWVLKAKATYNLRWYGTGAQGQNFWIAFGEGTDDYLHIYRGVDQWYGANYMLAQLVSDGISVALREDLRAPDDVVIADWLRYTYWFEVTRKGQEITVRVSYDGTNYFHVFTASLISPVGSSQRAIISANVWTTAGSHVDWDYIYVEPSVRRVEIDIKPGSFPNSINPKSKGNVPVAILSDSGFDATTVDRSTVVFAGASPLLIGKTPEDVNGDGLLDVVLHFNTQSLNLKPGDTEACLNGKTLGGQDFEGCDSVRIVK